MGGIIFWLIGFGIAYGGEPGGFIGSKYFAGVGWTEDNKFGDWFFQYAFASTAATIVSGSLAERVNIADYLGFSLVMTGFIYPVVVCWTWGGGWLTEFGYVDFAGSGVVHLAGGVAGFVGAAVLGPRIGLHDHDEEGGEVDPDEGDPDGYNIVARKYLNKEWDILRIHEFVRQYDNKRHESDFVSSSPQHVVLGTLILWVGWLLFNGGSSLKI